MTQGLVEGVGWSPSVLVRDWYTQAVVGHYAGVRCATQPWLEALAMAVNRQFPQGVSGQGMALMRDHGCQPTSTAFMQTCATVEIHHTFTRYYNPKGKAETKRVRRTLKEEGLGRHEWTCPLQLMHALKEGLGYDNEHY